MLESSKAINKMNNSGMTKIIINNIDSYSESDT